MYRTTTMVGRYPIPICIACLMHLIWALGLYVDSGVIFATGLHTVLVIAKTPTMAALIFATVSCLAMLGVVLLQHRGWRVMLILPQQMVLWFSVVGAVHAMYLGQFADGIRRSNWYLVVDQIPVVLITLGHMVALLFIAERQYGGRQ